MTNPDHRDELIKVYEEALGFYADSKKWQRVLNFENGSKFELRWASNLKEQDCAYLNCGGGRARLALAQGAEIKKRMEEG